MPPILLDSSLYITALRRGHEAVVGLRRLAPDAPVWLSAVVLEELYAGVRGRDRGVVERLEHDFERAKRIVVPNLRDWVQTGEALSQLAVKNGYDRAGRARLTNDALIATSAGRLGITVVTANPRDFARLAQVRPFQWRVWSP